MQYGRERAWTEIERQYQASPRKYRGATEGKARDILDTRNGEQGRPAKEFRQRR